MGWLEDLGNAAGSAASTVGNGAAAIASTAGDIIEGTGDAIIETAENVVETGATVAEDAVNNVTGYIAANWDSGFGIIANVVGGIIVGTIRGLRDLAVDYAHILKDQLGMIGALLRLDFARFIDETLQMFIDIGALLVDAFRFMWGGYFAGAIADNFLREELRAFVEDLIRDRMAGDPNLEIILSRLKIKSGDWGLRFSAHSAVFMMDTAEVDVKQMHEDGILDLYALAGLLSFDSFQPLRARTSVSVIEPDGKPSILPVNRYHISSYLQDPESTRLKIYAITPAALHEQLTTAVNKFKKMGIWLEWNDWFLAPTLGDMTTRSITEDEYLFRITRQSELFHDLGIKPDGEPEEPVRAITAFRYKKNRLIDDNGNVQIKEINGQVCGRNINEGSSVSCSTPDRKDGCCILVERSVPDERGGDPIPLGSGVIVRDVYPPYFSKFVLAHEIGHYFGLCHFGHDGFQNIMFRLGNVSPVSPGLLRYYLYSEPEFSPVDAKNVWRFIVDQMPDSL